MLTSAILSAVMASLAFAAPAPTYRLAVVELRNEAELRPSEIAYLTDLARTQASKVLGRERFLIMTRESIVALLPPGKTLADCAKGQCEVEVGRTIGADYIVTGEILSFGAELRLNLKAHACQSAAFLGSAAVKGDNVNDLESGLGEACERLYGLVRAHAGVDPGLSASIPLSKTEAHIGVESPVWNPEPKKQRWVTFASNPPQAVVMLNGQLLCQGTPCTKLLAPGVVSVVMQREGYEAQARDVEIPAPGGDFAVEWKLTPTFGRLTVRSTPDSLRVTLNGDSVGTTPIVGREVEAGEYEVRIADKRFYEQGERVVIARGEERTVQLAPAAREGAIDVSAKNPSGADVFAKVYVDEKFVGYTPGVFKVIVGWHRIRVTDNKMAWRDERLVAEHETMPVVARLLKPIPASEETSEVLAGGAIVKRGTLMWLARDNGTDVSWEEAAQYCRACRTGGYDDWRLPAPDELKRLFDRRRTYIPKSSSYEVHVVSPIELTTAWQWSSTPDELRTAFRFSFYSGLRRPYEVTSRDGARVLCVRKGDAWDR